MAWGPRFTWPNQAEPSAIFPSRQPFAVRRSRAEAARQLLQDERLGLSCAVLQGKIGRARPGRFLLCSGTVLASLRRDLTADQGEEGPQSGSVGGGGVELDSGGKHSRCMEAFKAFHLALSASSCAISISISLVRRSISRTGRQFSIDNNCRHRGKDEKESPLLLELDGCVPLRGVNPEARMP